VNSLPRKNVYWHALPEDAKVELIGCTYVATQEDGEKAVVFWSGRDKVKAQKFLDVRVQRTTVDRQ
jgi:hypothetical protein